MYVAMGMEIHNPSANIKNWNESIFVVVGIKFAVKIAKVLSVHKGNACTRNGWSGERDE